MIKRIALKSIEYALAFVIVGLGLGAAELMMLGAFKRDEVTK